MKRNQTSAWRKSAWMLLTLFLWVSVSAQSLQEKADLKLKAFVEATQVPGLSISVSQKGQLVFSKGYGYSDLENKTPVDPSKTKFRIGSVSKTLTATGLALLYQQDKIDLDAPIQKYVPTWPKKKYEITLRQLGGHVAGIRHYKGDEFLSTTNYPTVTDGLAIFINDPLINRPSTTYSYSSYGWNLISAAMETANAGEFSFQTSDFIQYMQQQVFDKLGMDNTVAEYADRKTDNLTKFYQSNEENK